jgi:transposase
VKQQRASWKQTQPTFCASRMIVLDETWAKTNLARLFGRAPRGQRLIEKIPFGHWKTTTFLSAISSRGWLAPLVVDGPINGAVFLAWVKQHLVALLRPGDIVVMDNLISHQVAGVKEAITAARASLMYLPPYSPDLNPIELAFSKLRRLLRTAAARTVDALESAIANALDQFTNREILNYFKHCGYRHT